VPDAKLPPVLDSIGAGRVPTGTPTTVTLPADPPLAAPAGMMVLKGVPFSTAIISVTNGWQDADDAEMVTVYAGAGGAARPHPGEGEFVIINQTAAGTESEEIVDVPGTTSLSIVNAPVGAAVETSALTGSIPFTSANGLNGTLDLATDTASVNGSVQR
jgi:hypothetical protein